MKDGFEARFVVELDVDAVWEALASRRVEADDEGGEEGYVLPAFPSLVPQALAGARGTPLAVEPGKLLRVRKAHEPCAGTEIAVALERAESGTRVTIVQSGFGPWLEKLRDTFHTHWLQIVADFRLWLERGVVAPATPWWRVGLEADWIHTPGGLEITSVQPAGFAKRAGLQAGDLLVSLRGVRLYDTQQLWTVFALSEPGQEAQVGSVRGREWRESAATFGAAAG